MTKLKTWFNANRYFGLGIIGAALHDIGEVVGNGGVGLGDPVTLEAGAVARLQSHIAGTE
ncbi:hypothetical protein GV789_29125, partial [Nocardia cyriacigeorgica]|nr:hypothetical protein [Nocardia cyriacigeorgica]